MSELLARIVLTLLFFGCVFAIFYLMEGNGLFKVKIEDFATNKTKSPYLLR
jgi:hypothetical protein